MTPILFHTFDRSYLDRLRSKDAQTQEHFIAYFTRLIHLKLRRYSHTGIAADDICQETFSRVLLALQAENRIRQPERLGAFVISVCSHVLMEQQRYGRKETPIEDAKVEISDPAIGALDIIAKRQMRDKVHQIVNRLSERDRYLIRAVFFEECDADVICREMGVGPAYFRVLVHRAKKSFKSLYRKEMDNALQRSSLKRGVSQRSLNAIGADTLDVVGSIS